MKIGILALQGSFAEHANVLDALEREYLFVRKKEDLDGLTHLIIPGGESTVMKSLLKEYGMWETLMEKISSEVLQLYGTCAGAILGTELGLEAEIDRNAYGSQQASFRDNLDSEVFEDLEGGFIRAPKFVSVGKKVEVLASYKSEPVLVRQGNILAGTFHPEIEGETRVHEYFLEEMR